MRALVFSLVLLVPSVCAGQDVPEDAPTSDSDDDVFEEVHQPTGVYHAWPTWYLSAGATWLAADGVYALRIPDVGTIPILDFDLVGLNKRETSHYLSASWRSAHSRWGAWLANWRFDASGERSWSTDIPIDDLGDIPVGASVVSNFDADFYIAEVTWSAMRTERLDVGLGLGFHIVDLETDILAKANIGDFETELLRGDLDTLAPLPNLTGYGAWRITPRLALTGRLGWFGLSVDKYSGDMINAHAMLDFHLSRRWSIGAGYQFVRLDLRIDEIEDEGFTELYDIDFDGPVAYLTLTF